MCGNTVVKKYEANGIAIEIDEDMCIGAEECVKICPANVFEMVDGKSTAPRVAECTSCCACVDACPTKCIKHSACP